MALLSFSKEEWWQTSNAVYDQTSHLSRVLGRYGLVEQAAFFEQHRAKLDEVWQRTRSQANPDAYRGNFVDIYDHFLRRLPETSETLQELLGESWKTGLLIDGKFKTQDGEIIFGFSNIKEPRGIGNGQPVVGFLPFMVRRLITADKETTFFGTPRPRTSYAAKRLAMGYDAPLHPALSWKKKPPELKKG